METFAANLTPHTPRQIGSARRKLRGYQMTKPVIIEFGRRLVPMPGQRGLGHFGEAAEHFGVPALQRLLAKIKKETEGYRREFGKT